MSLLVFTTICLLIPSHVVFGVIHIIEDYIPQEDLDHAEAPHGAPRINVNYLQGQVIPTSTVNRLEALPPLKDLQRIGNRILNDNAEDIDSLKILYQQIYDKDLRRIPVPDPAHKTPEQLDQFRTVVAHLIRQAVDILSQNGSELNLKYLKGSDLEYSQGWDRLASLIVHFYWPTLSDQCVSMFINMLDSEIGRLLNPNNDLVWFKAAYIALENVSTEVEVDQDDIRAFHLDFVKSFGVGYLQPLVLNMVFRVSMFEKDLFKFWMKLFMNLAIHFKSIRFTPEQCKSLSVSDVYDLLNMKSEFHWGVLYPLSDYADAVHYRRHLTDSLVQRYSDCSLEQDSELLPNHHQSDDDDFILVEI